MQRSKCPKFGKMRGTDPQLCPFTGLTCPFSYTARMPLFSRISPLWSQSSAIKNRNRKNFKATKDIWSYALVSTLTLSRVKDGEGWIFSKHFKHGYPWCVSQTRYCLEYDERSTRRNKTCSYLGSLQIGPTFTPHSRLSKISTLFALHKRKQLFL